MRTTKNWIGLVAALLPVLFCGGLLLYLNNVRDLLEQSAPVNS